MNGPVGPTYVAMATLGLVSSLVTTPPDATGHLIVCRVTCPPHGRPAELLDVLFGEGGGDEGCQMGPGLWLRSVCV